MSLLGLTEKKPYLDNFVSIHLKIFLRIFLILVSLSSFGQEKRKIIIKKAPFFEKDKINFPDASLLTRNDKDQVLISHDGIMLYCNKAYFYENKNFVEAFGNVVLKQGDSIYLNADYVEYNGDIKFAFAKGNVTFKEPQSILYSDSLFFNRNIQQVYYKNRSKLIRNLTDTILSDNGIYYLNEKKYSFKYNVDLKTPKYLIYSDLLDFYTLSGKSNFYGPTEIFTDDSEIFCEVGYYDTTNDNGYFIKNAEIDFNEYKINADSIYFDKRKNYSSATNNIKILDTLNKTLTKGHFAEIFRNKDSMLIEKRAIIASFKEVDTTYIHGETIIVTGKKNQQIIKASENGKILSGKISGKCDSIHYSQITGIVQMINFKHLGERKRKNPILWNGKSQITGDSIRIKFDPKNSVIDSLYVYDNAFIIEKDSLGEGYNQISGKKFYGKFFDGKLIKVDIVKNAESIYYLRNSENELVGIDKSKSALIQITFVDDKINSFTKINQINGKTFPENDIKENDKILRGFYYREDEIIENIEDLFNDDKEFILPKIEQLEVKFIK